jgi:predicted nucleic acid-binding protein
MVQELLFHRMRRGSRTQAVTQARDASELCFLHGFDAAVLTRALELVSSHDRIGGRGAVHAATALQHGLTTIVSPDSAFDGIGGLTRITAAEWIAGLPYPRQ